MSQMTWFKFYSEMIDDPKIKRLSTHQKWVWVTLLCLASRNDTRGQVSLVTDEIPLSNWDIGHACGFDPTDEESPEEIVDLAIKEFVKMRMIAINKTGIITIQNFDKRQSASQSDAERSASYRERQKSKVTAVTQASRDETASHVTSVTLDLDLEKIRLEKIREEEIKNKNKREESDPALAESPEATNHDKFGKKAFAQNVINLFGEICPTLPQPKLLDTGRIDLINARRKQHPEHEKLEFWGWFFAQVARSPLLMGQVAGRDGAKPFRANIDWLMNPANFRKVVDGNYSDDSHCGEVAL